MTLLELFRAATPGWEVLPGGKDAIPGAVGGFESERDARWTAAARDAAPAVLALYAAVKAYEARMAAGRAPLAAQRKALQSALRALEA